MFVIWRVQSTGYPTPIQDDRLNGASFFLVRGQEVSGSILFSPKNKSSARVSQKIGTDETYLQPWPRLTGSPRFAFF
jgi:hypothetical protein